MSRQLPVSITFSRYKLAAFLACQRQFQLRYLQEFPWPPAPQDDLGREAGRRGQQFHRLLERHFLGLAVDDPGAGDSLLRQWWHTFRREQPLLPAGERLPELTLTVPLKSHLLTGRFDLLVLGEENVHIYDWKTTRPRPEADLRRDWQTRLYLALAVEGGSALYPGAKTVAPHQVTLTYWFVQDPAGSVTFRYDAATHEENWAEIVALVAQIDATLAQEEIWPLTDDLQICARCRYQVLCGRQEAVAALRQEPQPQPTSEDSDAAGPLPRLEPEMP